MVGTILLLATLGTYLIGTFPAAVTIARASAERGHCHHEDRRGGRDSYNTGSRSWCNQFHRAECWRAGEQIELVDLKFAPLAFLWPVLLLGVVVLRQANKKPSRRMLEAQISRLEREAGISTSPGSRTDGDPS